MSSSRVLSSVSIATQAVPVGTDEFISRYQKQVEENSTIGQRIKRLEEQHRVEMKQSYQRGFKDGDNAGLQRGLAASRQLESELRLAIKTLLDYQNKIYTSASKQLFDLAFSVANRITHARGEAEPEIVLDTINKCLREILDKSKLTIRVNPAQAEFVRKQLESLSAAGESLGNILVEPDSRISSGGCLIETDSGNAEARLENQLQMLKEKLLTL